MNKMGLDLNIYEADEESDELFDGFYEEESPFPDGFNVFWEDEEFINIEKICTDRNGTWSGQTYASPEFGDPAEGMLIWIKDNKTKKTTKYFISNDELHEKYSFIRKVWKLRIKKVDLGFWNMGYSSSEKWKNGKTPFDEDVELSRYHFTDETLDEIQDMVVDEYKLNWLKEFRENFRKLLAEGRKVFVFAGG
jgi:hypothetical protein